MRSGFKVPIAHSTAEKDGYEVSTSTARWLIIINMQRSFNCPICSPSCSDTGDSSATRMDTELSTFRVPPKPQKPQTSSTCGIFAFEEAAAPEPGVADMIA